MQSPWKYFFACVFGLSVALFNYANFRMLTTELGLAPRSLAIGKSSENDLTPRRLATDVSTHEASPASPERVLPRTLFGIFSIEKNHKLRRAFRELFSVHPKVCSLHQYQTSKLGGYSALNDASKPFTSCEYIYTFVVGANPTAETELLNSSRPILVPLNDTNPTKAAPDLNWSDMTLLNIRENMNEGKSQTWLYYAAQVAADLDIEYVGKTDLDSLPFLDLYFAFAAEYLPPAPYNRRILAGSMVNKLAWYDYCKKMTKAQTEKESFFIEEYGLCANFFHMYAEGQCYIMSRDLAQGAVEVARTQPSLYMEAHEDHDVSTMAFLSENRTMVTLMNIPRSSRFWRHPVKTEMGHKKWQALWDYEKTRLEMVLAGKEHNFKRYPSNWEALKVMQAMEQNGTMRSNHQARVR